MITVLVPPGVAAGRRQGIDDAEQRHLRVRRAAEGESVALRDGAGLVGIGRLVAAGRGWEVEVETVGRRARPAPLTLAVGAGDRERFAWLVEKAVELGATEVVPLETEHVRGVATRVREPHLAKLRRHAQEALKQCGAAWVPEVPSPVGLGAFLDRAPSGVRWLADAAGAAPPVSLGAEPVTIVVGPEGGLTDGERESLRRADYVGVALGPHTLRFETAALAAASAAVAARLRGTHG